MSLFDIGVFFGSCGAGARNAAWLGAGASAAGMWYYMDKKMKKKAAEAQIVL